jgi:dTDP-4-amino-4,6-dideoxygalactose transaminase
MPDVLAAIGLVQLRKLPQLYAARHSHAMSYADAFQGLPLSWQPLEPPGGRHANHLFIVQLGPDAPLDRDRLMAGLKERRIGSSIHFRPLHLQSYYRERYGYRPGDLPQAEWVYRASLSLPLFPDMTADDVAYVAGHLRDLLTG